MKNYNCTFALVLGAALATGANAQCPLKDKIMGTPDAAAETPIHPDATTGATKVYADSTNRTGENRPENSALPTGKKRIRQPEHDSEAYRRFRLGGYGEMVAAFKDYGSNRFYGHPEGNPKENRATISIPRFGLAIDYKFSKKWILGGEIEFESGGTGQAVELENSENGEYETEIEKGGEVAIEQFHITRLIHPAFNLRAGHMIVPIGLTNTHHEPMNFFGTVRPEGETRIIPSTWHETGLAVFGSFGKKAASFDYQLMIVTGLNANGFDRNNWVKKGKQGFFEEDNFTSPGYVARLDWTGIKGLRAGASYYYCRDAGKNADISSAYSTINGRIGVNIFTVDAQYENPYVIARANVITGHVENAGPLSNNNVRQNSKSPYSRLVPIAERAVSYGGEVGLNLRGIAHKTNWPELIPFVRYEYYNPQEKGPGASLGSKIYRMDDRLQTSMWTAGLNYRVGNGIVVKADYTTRRIGGGKYNSENEFAIGVAFNAWFLKK